MIGRASGLLLVLVIAAAALVAGEDKDQDKRIRWVTSYEAGMKAAKEAGRPAFLDFMTEW